jgi:hypothetical protein
MQQVNLYQPVVQSTGGTLASGAAIRILLLVCMALLGIWGFGQWQVSRLQDGVDAVRAQRAAQESLTAAGFAHLEQFSQEELDAHVAALAAALDVKTQALQMLRSEGSGRSAAFATRLQALARRHVDGIWLDHITLGGTANALNLSGTAMSPALVPQYLRSLASDPALRGAQIDDFTIGQSSPASPGSHAASLKFRASNRSLAALSPEGET